MTPAIGDIALSIVIPAFNEADNLTPVVHETLEALTGHPWIHSFELIVVDDGSTDETGAVADRLAAAHPGVVVVFHHPSNRGFGAALKTGFAASRGTHVSFMSADGEVGPDQVINLLRDVGDAGLVLGRRERKGNVPWYRDIFTAGFNIVTRLVLGFLPEATGIYLVRGDLLRRMTLHSDTGLANLEVIMYCRQWRCPIGYGVTHVRPRLSGSSKVTNVRTMWRIFVEMARLRVALRRRAAQGEVA